MTKDPYVGASYSDIWSRAHASTYEALADPATRRRKALKILAVVEDFVGRELGQLACLDVGCAAGAISSVLAGRFGELVGYDPDEPAIDLARARHNAKNLRFTSDPAGLGQFDVVVCNHVYEHVHEQAGLVRLIDSALAPGGCVYFSAGNALMLLEGHYGLPFLAALPPSLGSAYLRLAGRGDVYRERHLTLFGLRRLWRGFEVHDYTIRVLREPRRFQADDLAPTWLPPAASALLGATLYPLLPTYIWMLTRR